MGGASDRTGGHYGIINPAISQIGMPSLPSGDNGSKRILKARAGPHGFQSLPAHDSPRKSKIKEGAKKTLPGTTSVFFGFMKWRENSWGER